MSDFCKDFTRKNFFFFSSKIYFYYSCLLIRGMKLTCSDLEVTESKLQLFGFYLLLVCSSACISGYLVGGGGGEGGGSCDPTVLGSDVQSAS